ncbi:MAG: pseudouridine synthase, partial [Kiritimatiellaeota bacterium]|nr:pseudouridine synthase [Kiritimatiellota bacterium]
MRRLRPCYNFLYRAVIPEPSTSDAMAVLFRDGDFAVVDKPANLPCHPSGRYRRGTLEWLLRRREGFPATHFVNRLDRETSGLVVVALHAEAASRLGKLFAEGRVHKTYIAIVEGCFPETPQEVAGHIFLQRGDVIRKKRVFVPTGDDPLRMTNDERRM